MKVVQSWVIGDSDGVTPLAGISLTEEQASLPGYKYPHFSSQFNFLLPSLTLLILAPWSPSSTCWSCSLPYFVVSFILHDLIHPSWSAHPSWPLNTATSLFTCVTPTSVNIHFYHCLMNLVFMTIIPDDSIHHRSLDPPTQRHNIIVYTFFLSINMSHQCLMSSPFLTLQPPWLAPFLVTPSINTTTIIFVYMFYLNIFFHLCLMTPFANMYDTTTSTHSSFAWLDFQSSVLVQVFSEGRHSAANHNIRAECQVKFSQDLAMTLRHNMFS